MERIQRWPLGRPRFYLDRFSDSGRYFPATRTLGWPTRRCRMRCHEVRIQARPVGRVARPRSWISNPAKFRWPVSARWNEPTASYSACWCIDWCLFVCVFFRKHAAGRSCPRALPNEWRCWHFDECARSSLSLGWFPSVCPDSCSVFKPGIESGAYRRQIFEATRLNPDRQRSSIGLVNLRLHRRGSSLSTGSSNRLRYVFISVRLTFAGQRLVPPVFDDLGRGELDFDEQRLAWPGEISCTESRRSLRASHLGAGSSVTSAFTNQ